MKYCPACGTENLDEAAACPDCGYSFETRRTDQATKLYTPEAGVLPPDTLISGRYEVVEELGRGGMGIVYRVRDLKLRGREVALKMTHRELVFHDEARQRFKDEVLLCLDLHHPNIVIVHHLDDWEESLFFTMAYIPGKSLRALIDERKDKIPPFTLEESCRITGQVLDALAYAHKTTIHRDVKPENILVTGDFPEARVTVLDFGIAKVLSASRFTRTAQSMGTAYYMSPEQMQGAKEIDLRSDLYSVGMILYEMLTGRIAAGRFKLPGELVPGLPAPLDELVEKTLSPEPSDRFESASVMRRSMEEILDRHAQERQTAEQARIRQEQEREQQAEREKQQREEKERQEAERRKKEEEQQRIQAEQAEKRKAEQTLKAALDALQRDAAAQMSNHDYDGAALTIETLRAKGLGARQIQQLEQRLAAQKERWLKEQEKESVEPVPPPPSPPDAKPANRVKKTGGLIVVALGLLILIFGAWFATVPTDSSIPFIEEKPDPVVEARPFINQKSVDSHFITSDKLGKLLVITGTVENKTSSIFSHIEIKGFLSTREKKEAMARWVYCGNLLSEAFLKTADMETINQRLANKDGINKANTRIMPNTSIAFMVIFSDYPENINNYAVKIHSFQKGAKTGDQSDRKDVLAVGSLRVTSVPAGADVFIDGLKKGVTPQVFEKVKPGRYNIRVDRDGYISDHQTVRVEAGREGRASFTLAKVQGRQPAVKPEPVKTKSPVQQQSDSFTNSLGMKFIWIRPGSFMMGSPFSEPERYDNETQHRVTLTKGYYLMTTEVTQGQWKAVMGANPSRFKNGDDYPVERVSWTDVQAFIRKLNARDSRITCRLPTEAEWEYAARAGTSTPFAFGRCLSTDQANYNGNYPMPGCAKGPYRKKTTRVGRFSPNAWGLFDMHGNVWEWCSDWYGSYPSGSVTDPKGPSSGSRRVYRGGSWDNSARDCRSADRLWYTPGFSFSFLGFRLAGH